MVYIVEEQKLRVNDNIYISTLVGGKSEIQLECEVSWKKERNEEFGDLILIIKLKMVQF